MAAPSYSEDLNDLNLAESVTGWVELTGTVGGVSYATQGAPAGADPDYPFIQGQFSVTQDCTKTGIGSLVYNNGAGVTHGTDGAYFVWQNYMVASNINTYAQGGFQVCVGNSTTAFRVWYVGGVDKSPYPYGGWVNHAVNTTVTPDGTAGTPTATEQYIGAAVNVANGSSKGEVHNVDVIRYGRGSSIFEFGDLANGYATFAGFAALNDNNSNRWGLISETSGGYLWKGRMALGTVTNPVDFRDSNLTVFIQWTPKVTANFNLIEVINASSIVQWSNINVVCTDITTASRGRFLMTNNATVTLTSCNFTDMDTFTFLSNATLDTVTFNNANAITTGGATITSCTFNSVDAMTITSAITGSVFRDSMRVDITASGASLTDSQVRRTTDATSMLRLDAAVSGGIENITFIGEATNKHAVELTALPTGGTLNWTHNQDSNFATGTTGIEGTDFNATANGDETLYINVTSSSPITISVATGADAPSIRRGASYTGTITVTGQQKTIDVHVQNAAGSPISGAYVWINDGTNTLANTTTNGTGDITQVSYGGTTNSTLRVRIFGYKPYEATIATATGNVNQTVQLIADAQQVAVPTLNNAGTITVNTGTSLININGTTVPNHTTIATMDSMQDLYEYLMNLFANPAYMQFEHPMESATQRDYSFVNGWTFAQKDIDYKYLRGGTIEDAANNLLWSNVKSIGSLYSASTRIYVVQGLEASNTALTPWYPLGNIDILVKVKDGTFIQSTDDSQTAINGGVWTYARYFSTTYDHFFIDLSTGGQNIIALATLNDLNNQTAPATVSGYSDITLTFGTISRSLDGTNFYNYEVEVDCNGRTLSQVYEYLKYITSYDYSATVNGEPGYDYRNALEGTYTNVDSKQAPFGTFAGGKMFGARGVFLANMNASDITNYELIDTNGNTRTPPLQVAFSLTGLKNGSEVRLFDADSGTPATEVAGVESMTNGVGTGTTTGVTVTGSSDNNTFTYTYTYASDINVFAQIVNNNYEYLRIEGLTLSNTTSSIPVSQNFDRNYNDPV